MTVHDSRVRDVQLLVLGIFLSLAATAFIQGLSILDPFKSPYDYFVFGALLTIVTYALIHQWSKNWKK